MQPLTRSIERGQALRPSPQEIEQWLRWAGGKLLSMPIGDTRPKRYKVAWPEVPPEVNTAYDWDVVPFRPVAPSGHEIELMDRVFDLILLIEDVCIRRVLQARALRSNFNGKQLYSWATLGLMLKLSPPSVKRRYRQGISLIALRACPIELRSLKAKFDRI